MISSAPTADVRVIDSYTEDHTGWAQFSEDMTLRFRLARSFTGEPIETIPRWMIAVFVMLNPSTADAFVLDPTVRRCVRFAKAWGASALEVVNLFALRATDPARLYLVRSHAQVMSPHQIPPEDVVNDRAIMAACDGAHRVVAAWGTHGGFQNRGDAVRRKLHDRGVKLCHLGLNKDGSPKHPLYIKGDTSPSEWISES